LDPTSLLGPGETFGNDGAAELLRICRYLSRELSACVRLIHHVSQAVARGGTMDQYVARGGTAFVDNSRFQHQLVIVDERKLIIPQWGAFVVPKTASEIDIAKGRVLALLVHKLSYSERDRVPIFLLRKGFEFLHMETEMAGDMTLEESDAQASADATKLWEFVSHKFKQGVLLTARQLEGAYLADLNMTQARLRKAVIEAERRGLLAETDLPEEERRGARKTYLHPADVEPM